MRIGEWYYSKQSNESKIHEIKAPDFKELNKIKIDENNSKINCNNEKGKCFICSNFPKKENLLITLCCGIILCNDCYMKNIEIGNNNKNNNDKQGNNKCFSCKKLIDSQSIIKLYP